MSSTQPWPLSELEPATQPDDPLDSVFEMILRPPPNAIEVGPGLFVTARFGAWNEDRGTRRPGQPSANVGLRDCFGVTISFFQTKDFVPGKVTYREVLTLPAKPPTWGDVEHLEWPEPVRPKTTISPDGRTSATEQQITLQAGQIIPSYTTEDGEIYILSPFPGWAWEVAEGEPPGDWTIEAHVNEKQVIRASFQPNFAPQ